jgi:hypothetical protein
MSDDLNCLSNDEALLIRLFRAVDPEVRESIIARVLGAALDLRSGRIERLEDAEWEEIEDSLWHEWPADWPERSVVDLDHLGDPGAWLRDGVGEPWLRVLLTDQDDEQWATELATSYAEKLIADGYAMPSEFNDDPVYGIAREDDRAILQTEFVAFLRAWRGRILRAVEFSRTAGRDATSGKPLEPK